MSGDLNGMNGLWSGQQIIDPVEMQSRFCLEDGMAFMDSIFTEPSEEARQQIERIRGILDMLPPREADFVDLYYLRQFRQTDIAHIFKVSQPTVCYRLQRATARIQFLLRIPDVDLQEMRGRLAEVLTDPLDINIVVLMCQTTCQSEVAQSLGVSQGLVRHRFIRSIGRMREREDMQHYVTLFEEISNNLNILREVRRSSTDSDAGPVCVID